MSKTTILKTEDNVATIILNRPSKLNSLHPDLIKELTDILIELDEKEDVRVVLLTGSGNAFCAGGDLPYLNSLDNPVSAKKYIESAGKIISEIRNLSKPVIAMVSGAAAGAGFNLALACDIIYCSESAKFGQSFANISLIPDCGGTYLLPQVVGIHKAKELMFTAKMIDAEEAYELGIVNKVIADDKLEEITYEFAKELTEGPPIAISNIKKMLNQSADLTLDEAMRYEEALQTCCLQTEDNKEGISAFKEKRKPEFKGK